MLPLRFTIYLGESKCTGLAKVYWCSSPGPMCMHAPQRWTNLRKCLEAKASPWTGSWLRQSQGYWQGLSRYCHLRQCTVHGGAWWAAHLRRGPRVREAWALGSCGGILFSTAQHALVPLSPWKLHERSMPKSSPETCTCCCCVSVASFSARVAADSPCVSGDALGLKAPFHTDKDTAQMWDPDRGSMKTKPALLLWTSLSPF